MNLKEENIFHDRYLFHFLNQYIEVWKFFFSGIFSLTYSIALCTHHVHENMIAYKECSHYTFKYIIFIIVYYPLLSSNMLVGVNSIFRNLLSLSTPC